MTSRLDFATSFIQLFSMSYCIPIISSYFQKIDENSNNRQPIIFLSSPYIHLYKYIPIYIYIYIIYIYIYIIYIYIIYIYISYIYISYIYISYIYIYHIATSPQFLRGLVLLVRGLQRHVDVRIAHLHDAATHIRIPMPRFFPAASGPGFRWDRWDRWDPGRTFCDKTGTAGQLDPSEIRYP